MSCCGVTIEAHRNADLRKTYEPRSRNYTLDGFSPLMQIRDGATVLMSISLSATVNGSVFSVVGDSLVLTLKKADALSLASGPGDRLLSYDIVLSQGGIESWFIGGDFILLDINATTTEGEQNVTVDLNGQSVDVTIMGGNIGIGASVLLADLNQAVEDAENSADAAADSLAAVPGLAATAGAAAGTTAGAAAGTSAGTTAGAAAGTETANAIVAAKANTAADNISASTWRTALDVTSTSSFALGLGAGLVGFSHTQTYLAGTVGAKLKNQIRVSDAPFNGNLLAAVTECSSRGGGVVFLDATVTLASSTTLTIPRGVSLQGVTDNADPGNPSFAGTTGGYAALAAMPKVLIPSTSTIAFAGTQSVRGVCFARTGLAFDGTDLASNYAGTAITLGRTDAITFEACAFLGFSQAIKATATADWRINNCLIDCNNGVWQDGSFDKTFLAFNRFYNVLQSGVNGNDPKTQRDGYAYRFTGSANGGPSLVGNFAYGARYSYWFDTGGHYGCTDNWADGPTNTGNGLPLWADSVGVYIGSTGSANSEVNLTGFKVCAHAVNVRIGSGNYGTTFILGHHNWGAFNAVEIAGQKITIIGAAIRSYYGTGILFQNAAAANTAKLIGVDFYDSATTGFTPIEIDYGGGDAIEFGVVRYGGPIRTANRVPTSVARDGSGLVTAPEGREQFAVSGTGAIGDIQPRIPGKVITLTFPGTGLSFTGGNFKLVGGTFAPANADASITLRCNAAGTQWVEQSRAVF